MDEIRKITVELGDISADLSVEVEPRDGRIKSHAGIFTRIKGKSLKGGHQKELMMENGRFVSYEAIQLKVQYALLSLSQLSTRQIYSQKP